MSQETRVLYNAQCPVCSYEINHYATYCAKSDLPIRFDDLNSNALAHWGIDADTAARRLYVLKDGALYAGIPGFIVLWREMPRYRWLARVVSAPGIHWISCRGYDHILAPLIYSWHLRRLRRNGTSTVL